MQKYEMHYKNPNVGQQDLWISPTIELSIFRNYFHGKYRIFQHGLELKLILPKSIGFNTGKEFNQEMSKNIKLLGQWSGEFSIICFHSKVSSQYKGEQHNFPYIFIPKNYDRIFLKLYYSKFSIHWRVSVSRVAEVGFSLGCLALQYCQDLILYI